jgi:hypothetical protein
MKKHQLRSRIGSAAVLVALAAALTPAQESAAVYDAPLVVLQADEVPFTALLDFDGDGDMDAVGDWRIPVFLGTAKRRFALYLNDGTGRMTRVFDSGTVNDPLTAGPHPVEAIYGIGDLNGDGRDDFVLAYGRTVMVVHGNSQGTVAVSQSWVRPLYVRDLVVTPVDADTAPDLAIMDDDGVELHLNQGGTFGASAATIPLPVWPGSALRAGQMNGVGGNDLVVVSSIAAGIFPWNGAGFDFQLYAHDVADAMSAVGDVDGDGDDDLVLFGMSGYRLLRQLAPSVFALEPVVAGGPATGLADVDLDGDLDGVCCSSGGGGGPVIQNSLDSTFEISINRSGVFDPAFKIPGLGARHIAGAADMDGDGDVDLVAGRVIYFSRGGLQQSPHPGGTWTDPHPSKLADMDGDGDPDRDFGTGTGTGTAEINLGDGSFEARTVAMPAAPAGTQFVGAGVPGDFDGDGDLDLVVEHWSGTTFLSMRLLQNVGGGALQDGGAATAPGVRFTGFELVAPYHVVADLDGDGDQDVVAHAMGGTPYHPPRSWLNGGSGTFTAAPTPNLSPWPLEVADFTGDGLPDILGTGWMQVGLGGGAFANPRGLLPAPMPGLFTFQMAFLDRVTVGDFDGDGWLDVFAIDRTTVDDNVLCFLRNLGAADPGRFSRHPLNVNSNWTTGIAIAAGGILPRSVLGDDFDQDGDVDLVIWPVEQGAQKTSMLLRNTAADPVAWSLTPFLQVMTASTFSDVDGDGDRDAVAERITCNVAYHGPSAGRRRQYGQSFAGTGGALPVLGAVGPFRPDLPFELRVRGGLGGAPAVLLIGPSAANEPSLGAVRYVDWTWFGVYTLDGGLGVPGEGGLDLAFPPLGPGVAGVSAYAQVVVFDPAGPTGLSRTQGLELGF